VADLGTSPMCLDALRRRHRGAAQDRPQAPSPLLGAVSLPTRDAILHGREGRDRAVEGVEVIALPDGRVVDGVRLLPKSHPDMRGSPGIRDGEKATSEDPNIGFRRRTI